MKNPKPFFKIAYSNSLWAIFSATVIWGMFPLFFHFMGKFEEYPSVYLLFRYAITGAIFILLLFLFSAYYRKGAGVAGFVKAYWRPLLYGGVILFLARLFESLAFAQKITNFATIFAVALVPLMEPVAVWLLYRKWYSKWLFRLVFGDDNAQEMAAITSKNENYWMEYGLNATIILTAALFFIYGMQGNFNILVSDVPWHAYLWVLPSALSLQLYFHSLDYGFPDKPEKEALMTQSSEKGIDKFFNNFSPTLVKQSVFALIVASICGVWQMFSKDTVSKAFEDAGNPVAFWLSFVGGIVILGSIVAYIIDNAGFDHYEEEKENLPFQIRGVEWLGISTLMDPMIANILIVVCASFGLYLGAEGEIEQMKPAFFVMCVVLIVFLAVLKVLILRHNKLQEFKVFCFSRLRSRRTAGDTMDPDHFSSVALIRSQEEIRSQMDGLVLQEVARFQQGTAPQNELEKHLQYHLWLFNADHLEQREAIAVWRMKDGKFLYDANQLFERLLFHEHLRYFGAEFHIHPGRVILFFPDKLKSDEGKLADLVQAHSGATVGENDQLFYFLDVPGFEKLPDFVRDYLVKRFEAIRDRKRYVSIQNGVMMDVLERRI